MKIVYLIPPSEGKNHPLSLALSPKGRKGNEKNLFSEKPYEIAINATEKDLKCKGKRFEEAIDLNKQVCRDVSLKHLKNSAKQENIPAIFRYSGVMYKAIDYSQMNEKGQKFFEENFLIISGLYGILKPLHNIGNYKLPIETKGLYDFWGTKIIEKLNELGIKKVINLLPDSYSKLLYGSTKTKQKEFEKLRKFEIEDKIFFNKNGKKLAHGVKQVKGEWIREICERCKY